MEETQNEPQDDNKINRRDLINRGFLTGLAVTLGVVGINTVANAQGGEPKLDIKELKKIKKRATEKVKVSPSTGVRKNYQETVDRLKTLQQQILKLTGSSLTLKLADDLSRIEGNMSYAFVSSMPSAKFQKNNVEILLDQASNLFDRCLRDRSEWDSLSLNLFNLGLEISQFLDYDDIHKRETAAGYYDQGVYDKSTTLNVDRLAKDKVDALYTLFNQMFTDRWSADNMNAVANWQAQIAEWANPANANAGNIKALTLNLEQYHLAVNYVYNFLQKEGLASTLDQMKVRVANDDSKYNWEKANRDFRFERTEVERKYEYFKLAALQAEDGVLNFSKRLIPLRQRFHNDFSEAKMRIEAASDGLKEIYGYYQPVPKDNGKPDYFDQCVVWTRHAINHIIKFSQLDQSYVIPISIRKLYTDNDAIRGGENFANAIKNGTLNFKLEAKHFPDSSYLRIKGLSVFFSLGIINKYSEQHISDYNGTLSAYITPPKRSFYYHNEDPVTTNQAYVPTLRMNRLATRSFIRPPEVAGTSLYANLSPFGDWAVELPQIKSNNINSLLKINDVILDIYITTNRQTVL
jgi:hypothetical protein